ncbi:hypothetical protein BDC45DRAFT_146571 [Circinella umbellata]|nr:hypothetical protein BDC45DRAFT_146571 [Circinella umbellata]
MVNGTYEEETNDRPHISRKQVKRLTRLSVEELKQLVDIPEIVEPWDVAAIDPKLLVSLKSYRNTIPVPRHWCQRRPYLQRRKERKKFELPDFIKQTGIAEIRDAIKDKEAASRRSAKRRARLNPKLGKMDLDYQKLHDAFYRFQSKPKLTGHGDLYFEGKEYMNQFEPGKISTALKEALEHTEPPPWLFAMQNYGPPPNYPQLVIPGVNAPIPKGGEWGFKRGQWGHPPVDELNHPLYGNIFGTASSNDNKDVHSTTSFQTDRTNVDRTLWGELEPEEGDRIMELESNNNDNDNSNDDNVHDEKDDEYITEIQVIPEIIELKKRSSVVMENEDKDDYGVKIRKNDLYRILPQIPQVLSSSPDYIPSQNLYRLPTATKQASFSKQDVHITIDDPNDLEKKSLLRARYDEAQQERQPKHEDLSDMYLEHSNRQAKKQEKRERDKMTRRKDINL